ncbi:dTMP kinase [Hippea maritima]|uniref:Thymidylate kinase n=1 Tax=Hippea maritima (strain ATCC 700847 / DSM 10411 / MH2) TaxID=760142 RepID=F2LWP5_HIPMA|nr:dTMP kinase [Hippea maritima]AEA33023.1 Thymidylate kinase [Hippea maritima DSM 10411]
MRQKAQKNSCRYIAFEGIDASGKTTQAKLFVDFLKKEGFNVFFTKEPGGTIPFFREVLLNKQLVKQAQLFLFLADRAQTILTIKKKLDAGFVVVSDRSFYSTLAYQGFGDDMDIGFLKQANEIATGGLKPDLVFCIDITTNEMMNRLNKKDAIESKPVGFFERVRQGYIKLSKDYDNFYLVNGLRSIDDVFSEVVEIWKSI